MKKINKKVISVEDKSSKKGPWALVMAQDTEGKYSPSKKNVFGDAATIFLEGGEGIYEIEVEKNANPDYGYDWLSANKVGKNNGTGVNGSGVTGKVAEVVAKSAGTSNRVIIAGHALDSASRLYSAYIGSLGAEASQIDLDVIAKEVNAIAGTLFLGAEAIIKGKAVKKEAVKAPVQEETEFPDPVDA